jgi:Peptidase family M28
MRTALLAFALAQTFFSPAQHPVVQSIVDAVSIDSMMSWNAQLSGWVGTTVAGSTTTIISRHKEAAGNALAQQWIQEKFQQLGYSTTASSFSATGINVLAYKTGTLYPDVKVVLCAHYDAMPGGSFPAPAADDDGTGVVTVLEAARLMASHDFAYTVLFAQWDEEEQGLVGSKAYAAGQAANDSALRAVLNVDMIGYDSDGDLQANVHTRNVANSHAVKDTLLAVNTHYALGLELNVVDPGAGYSDQRAFWDEGFGAVLLIEDFEGDGNPNWHLSSDRVEYLVPDYFLRNAKLSIAAAATLAEPTGAISVQDATEAPFRVSAWPVPAAEEVFLRVSGTFPQRLTATVLDAFGRTVHAVERPLSPGAPALRLDVAHWPAGIYHVVVASTGVSRSLSLVKLPR